VSKATIERVEVTVFSTVTKTSVDAAGHRHPGPERPTTQGLLSIVDADEMVGRVLVQPEHLTQSVLDKHVRPVLLGADGLRRERLWRELAHRQRGAHGLLTDRALGYVDAALWDLAGKRAGLPVWVLLGGARDRMPAYASTMCGDEIHSGLSTPDDYAEFGRGLVKAGYRAIKLHTWMPPVPGAPDVDRDIAACAAVRDAVGPDVALMLDANHWYRRTEALKLGRALDELHFTWYEEPMEEASVQSYRWLAEQLATPVLGPEVAWGKYFTRAEWLVNGACDIVRAGVTDVGGITPTLKAVHLAEAFNVDCEIHGTGTANLAVLGATDCGRWYERGLVHPLVDYDEVPPHLTALADPMDAEGMVPMPDAPGLGDALDLDYIGAHEVSSW
jgi:L-alanine-DL-glutamate epimerase-like enolase superfamily enzyme